MKLNNWSFGLAYGFFLSWFNLAQGSQAGTVISWGSQVIPYISPGTKFTKIAAGYNHSLALKSDGTVVAWGDNSYWRQSTVPAGLTGVVAIASEHLHSLALKSDGTVVAWGSSQTNVPAGLAGVVAVAAGNEYSLALKSDGTVVAWGNNDGGQSTVPAGLAGVMAVAAGHFCSLALKSNGIVVAWGSNQQTNVPAGLTGVVAIAAGASHNLALKSNGTVVAWGNNAYGQTDVPAGLVGVVAIAVGERHSLALKSDGTVVAWGYYGEITVPAGLTGVLAIAAGGHHNLALKSDGTVVAWGDNSYGQSTVPAGLTGVVAIAAGDYGSCLALKSGGTIVAWGYNIYGQSTVPTGLTGVVAVGAGFYHSLALQSNGTVVAWGYNAYGQSTVPAGLTGVVAIAAGYYHSLALKSDGTVVAWGNNSFGQTNVPAGLTGVVAIAAGASHNLALKSDRRVVAWGYNYDGQTNVPAGLTGVVAIAAGYNHNLALKSDGRVVAWGYNFFGQTNVPTGLASVIVVAASQYHSLALKSDGTVVAWGNNSYGESTVPAGLNGVVAVGAGNNYSLALIAPPNQSPSITASPQGQMVQVGNNIAFTVTAGGTSPLNYQWRFNGNSISGATNATLSITNVQFANVGGYSVVVSNAYGSVVSTAATLNILAVDTSIVTKQISSPPYIARKPMQDSLVVVTHGFIPVWSPAQMPPWVSELASAIASKSPENWQVIPFDWSQLAYGLSPDAALTCGQINGALFGQQLMKTNWQRVHLISHSAGAAVIQAIADKLKAYTNPPMIQMTFLDPYTGQFHENQNIYGRNANWSDCYAVDDFTGGFTVGSLPLTYNVNVSWVDPAHQTVSYGLGQAAFSTHEYTHDFYLNTVTNTLDSWCAAGYGFPLSQEGGVGWLYWPNYVAGQNAVTPCGVAGSVQNPTPGIVSALVLLADANHAISSFGASLINNAGFILSSLSQVIVPNGIHPMNLTPATNTPAWLAVGLTVTNAVNFVQFDASFNDTNKAEGLLTAYWNTNEIGIVDERVASTNLQTYRFVLPATVTNGLHVLGFRLDAFNNTASSIMVTNVATGFVGVQQPIVLAATLTNGMPRLKLTAASNYTYLVQSSTNLMSWTPAALVVNSNGTAFFADPTASNSPAKYYRAVMP